MTDNEVREGMVKTKELKDQVEKVVLSKEKVDEDAVGIDLNPEEILKMKDIVQDAVDPLEA